jgi:hypothetical protein
MVDLGRLRELLGGGGAADGRVVPRRAGPRGRIEAGCAGTHRVARHFSLRYRGWGLGIKGLVFREGPDYFFGWF